jgi:hypothetical protein
LRVLTSTASENLNTSEELKGKACRKHSSDFVHLQEKLTVLRPLNQRTQSKKQQLDTHKQNARSSNLHDPPGLLVSALRSSYGIKELENNISGTGSVPFLR